MTWCRFRLLAVATLGISACSGAPQAQPAESAATSAWPTEQQAESAGPVNDVAGRLTTWLQLTGPVGAPVPARTYADFLSTRPVWPRWHFIEARYQQALAREPDDTAAAILCRRRPPVNAAALKRCTDVIGATAQLRSAARAAWRDGADSITDASLLQSMFAPDLTTTDSWVRFEREERAGQFTAATHTISTLSPDKARLAEVRLALRRNDPEAEVGLTALTPPADSDPMLIIDHAHWLRKAERNDDALTLWKTQGFTAERNAPATIRSAFWTEREALARTLLAGGHTQDAFTLACDTEQSDENRNRNAAFLSGWIALRQLHNPEQAEGFFRKLADSNSLLNRSGGYYWLGRAHAEEGNTASAIADWQRAAEFPQTFYGQMSVAALSHAGTTLLSPAQSTKALRDALQRWRDAAQRNSAEATSTEVHVDGSDLARAAQILVSWNDRPHAREFLALLLSQDTEAADQRALGELAQKLGLPDIGVAIARRASQKGISMPDMGWPAPFSEPQSDLPPGLALALMRQESNFNPDAVSVSGAVGLMQLLPGTARDMARGTRTGPVTVSTLYTPAENIQLGTAYLDQVYRKFDGIVPYTAAAYNAGPHRVSQWLQTGGDPARTGADQDALIDWIEQIPYAETRNYVKRVWESMAVYAVSGPA
ncbi:lytic transglycosylase domain-containing protein [Acetobacter fallax]|uniref:Transglycosylase SLT domain-containing protein n=1 Tax=Acetobacter fallax TaxID=1737473 RepID=A0ABX0K482_9PROT|nr:transglycosylase SLT domain-containing protein [Acetobacter fallax]NHO31141.1 transglycosylase SLT domain-containing protein [Acetobacter fallax]NHO34698.1 transglycosylase SLT domain-containing protein [Acetobacter fallax]